MSKDIDRLSSESVRQLEVTAEAFGLPVDAITVDRRGIVVPKAPMIYFADGFMSNPCCEVVDKPKSLKRYWELLNVNLGHLLSPFSKFNRVTHDIKESAIDVFLAGNGITAMLPDSRIILPVNIGFSPSRTNTKRLLDPEKVLEFEYNAWTPGMPERVRYQDRDGGTIDRIVFKMILKHPGENARRRTFEIEFTV